MTYQFRQFKNEARTDDLQLRHWVQCYKDATGQTRPTDDGPYQYAKLNVSAGTVKYDDAEYETVIRRRFPEAESGWSKARPCSPALFPVVVARAGFRHARNTGNPPFLLPAVHGRGCPLSVAPSAKLR